MKHTLCLILSCTILFSCQVNEKKNLSDGQFVLEQSIKYHDPNGEWPTAKLKMRLAEPRPQTPHRFSIVDLDNNTGAFRMDRNREDKVSSHLVSAGGENSALLDGEVVTDPEVIRQYMLLPERSPGYRNYYQFMYGIPMILQPHFATMKEVSYQVFDDQEVISLDFELKEAMISKEWRLYFSQEDYRLLGIETLNEGDEPGEYLIFNGEARTGNMKFARFRHWYSKATDQYLGSDILVDFPD